MHVVPDGKRLRLVYGRAVCRLESELQHGGLASGGRDDFLSRLHIYEVDVGQEVLLRALIRRLVIEARLDACVAGAHAANARAIDVHFWRPADQAAGGAVCVPVLDVGVRHEHDAHAVRSRLARERRVFQPLASETQRRQALEADAATDGTRSIVSNPLRLRSTRQKGSFDSQRALVALRNSFQHVSVPAISDSASAHASNAVLELDGRLVSASAVEEGPHERLSDAARRFAVCHVFENAVERLKVFCPDSQAAILSQDSEVEDLEDFWICGEELWLARCGRQLLHIKGDNKVHTTECVFGWMKPRSCRCRRRANA